MSDFKFNKCDDYTIILTNRSYVPYGHITNYKVDDINIKNNMNSANEFSFTVYKYMTLEDGTEYEEPLWDKITDLKLIYVKETNEYYEITVDGTDSLATYKMVTGKSLCEAELSQYNLYGIEINTEDDIARDEYVQPTLFYRSLDGLEVGSDAYNVAKDSSLLHRILYGSGKANNYKIKHVDESIANLQKTFSIDGKSIYDFFTGDCAEQFNCLFLFDSTDRSISVYDLYSVCMNDDCSYRLSDKDNPRHLRYRGDFKDVCPKCGSKHIKVYGKDTMVIVDKENLTDEISFSTNSDELKNCFHLKAGDDDMTAAIININPNGTAYLYYVPEYQREDMSKELVDKLVTYDELYDSYTNEYEQLMLNLYNAIDWQLYYMDEMMPGAIPPDERESSGSTEIVTKPVETAEQQIPKLSVNNLNYTALSSITSSTSLSTVESAIKNYAKVFVNTSKFKIETIEDSLGSVYQSGGNNCVKWTGKFKVTNFSDKDDTATSSSITLTIYDNYEEFVNQKIKKSIATDDSTGSIYDVLKIDSLDKYKDTIKLYGIVRLQSFIESIKNVEDILIQQGNQAQDLYYSKYHQMEVATENELNSRQAQYDYWVDKETEYATRKAEIQDILNFEKYLGNELYGEFCSYRRDQDYSNDNFVSDGLNNTDLFANAREYIRVAKEELVKAATLQCNISCKVKNLFALSEFEPFWDNFQIGNWITIGYDDEFYRLRLISVQGSLNDFSNLDVEFSSITKINNTANDIKDVLNQAQSMASSFNYISRQSTNGQKANDTLSEFQKKSMNASLYRLKNNDKEEIVIDNHGITARSWNDILDDYDPEQFAITHNTLNFTDDNWATCSLALEKHEFIRYDGNKFVKDIGYGLSAKFSQNMYSYAGQIIGGDIYSENYSSTAGTHLDLDKGAFSFAGGKFSYDPNKDKMTMRGVTIEWSTSTPPEIADISGLTNKLNGIGEYLDQLDNRIQSFSQTTDPSTDWGTTDLKNKHKGDLWFNPNDGLTKRWTGTSWEIITDNILESLAKSKAQVFTAKPTIAYFKGDMLIPVESFTYNGVTYKQEKAYRALKNSNGTTFNNSDWDALDYTNDDTIKNFINGDYANTIRDIGKQIDGKARAWYQSTDPSITWDTSEDHEGDLWYNTSATSQVTCIYKDSSWKQTNVPKAVFDTIDCKRQIFVKKPTSSYMTGDLWIISESDCTNGKITVNGTTYNVNSTLIAILPNGVTERATFTASDWTDISTQDGIIALDQSTQALNKFDDIANDGKITPTEKQQIKLLFENITADKNQINSQCVQYGINSNDSSYYTDYTNFNTAFTTLKNLISNSILNNMTTTIDVPSNYNSTLSNYYSKQNTIIEDIAKASKSYADSVLSSFVNGEYKTALENINTQIDGKADTFYQSTKPHSEYTNIVSNSTYDLYVGDLWYDTSTGKSYMYNKVANGSNFDYKWKYMKVPQEVYDKIDGVASIYSTIPSNPQENDTLIPNSDFTVGNITYISGKIYKYQKVDGNYVWNKVKYTDIEEVESKGYQTSEQVTTITEDTISTTNVLAENLQVNSANIQGELSADKIKGGTLTGDTNIQLGKFPDGTSPWLYKYAVVVDNDIYQQSGFNIYNPSQKMFGAACTCLINGTLFFEHENEYGGSRRSHIEMGSTYVDYSAGNLIGKTDIYSDRIEITAFTTGTSTTNIYTRVYAGHVDTSSDRRLKNDIQFIDTKFDAFINKLCDMPVSYYFNGQEFDGHRIGFIAQDVEKAIIDCGLTHDDINIVRKDDVRDENGNVIDSTYSLTYTDFIGLLFRKNRMQDDEINKMQNEIDILKKEVEELKNAINWESN